MPETCNFIKKESLTQMFSCEVCEIFKNTFFTEHLWATASVKNWCVEMQKRQNTQKTSLKRLENRARLIHYWSWRLTRSLIFFKLTTSFFGKSKSWMTKVKLDRMAKEELARWINSLNLSNYHSVIQTPLQYGTIWYNVLYITLYIIIVRIIAPCLQPFL